MTKSLLRKWINRIFTTPRSLQVRRNRPWLENLEDRLTPAALLWVDNTPGLPGEFTSSGGSQPANFTPTTLYATIQDAVNAANSGDTINVSNGTYTADVNVNKPVNLLGNQAGVNPNDGAWADTRTNAAIETVIHGAMNLSLRNIIVVDGFTFERTATNEGHILIGAGNATGVGAASRFDLENNRFIGTRDTGTAWAGIHTNFLNDPTLPGAQFVSHQNRIEIAGAASGSGILVNNNTVGTDGLGATTITDTFVANSPGNGFNVNRPGASALISGNRVVNDDIFTFRANNTVITGNTISDSPQTAISNTGGSTTWTASNNTIISPRAQAFLVGSTFTVDPVTNITITGNVVTVDPALVGVGVTTVFSPLQYALIDIRGNMTGTNLVSGNSIALNSNALNPSVIAMYGLRVRGVVGNLSITKNTLNGNFVGGAGDATLPPSSGLFVDTDLLTAALDLHVENTFINGWVNGVSVFDTNGAGPGAFGGLPVGATFVLFENDLKGNSGLGVASGTGELVNASANWWGTNTPAGVAAKVSANVDYTPWLAVGTDVGGIPANGFQGDFFTLHVDDNSPQVGSTGRIQEGVNLVTPGGTVKVAAGTFTENVTIAKALTLVGAGKGTDPASNTDLTNSGGSGITITSSDVTVSFLRIHDYTAGGASDHGVRITGGALSNITLDNIAVTNTASGVALEGTENVMTNITVKNSDLTNNRSSGLTVYFPTYVNGLTVDHCDIEFNAEEGILLYQEDFGGGSPLAAATSTNVHITNSTVSHNAVGQPGDQGFGNITIYGFNGNLEMSNVDIDATGADYGIYLRGTIADGDALAAAGVMSLTDVSITGAPVNSGLQIAWYSAIQNLTLSNVVVNVNLASGLSAGDRPRAALLMRHLANPTVFSLGNTVLAGTRGTGANHPYDLVASTANVDATGVTFTQTNPFAIEDVVLHRPDDASAFSGVDPTGLVTWVPSISIDDVSLLEGAAGTTSFVFTVTLSNASFQTVTVHFLTGDDTATAADGDYSANSGTLNFAPDATTRTITVLVNGDTKFELGEQFGITLSNATNATVADGIGLGTILNDDAQPAASFSVEAETLPLNFGTFVITINLSNASGSAISVPFTLGGTAVDGSDYSGVTASPLVFTAGQTSATINGTIINHGFYGGSVDKTLTLTLDTPTGANLGTPSTNTLTISTITSRPSFPDLTPQERAVQAFYFDELGRAGTQDELDGWLAELNGPNGAFMVANDIRMSPEGTGHLVATWYQVFLGRTPSGGEEMTWATYLQQGRSEEEVLSLILSDSGNEFYDRAQMLVGSGTPDQCYVRALYMLLLNRPGTDTEVNNYVANLASIGRQGVALGILQGLEFRTYLVESYFKGILHRNGTADEVNNFAMGPADAAGVRLAIEAGIEFFGNG